MLQILRNWNYRRDEISNSIFVYIIEFNNKVSNQIVKSKGIQLLNKSGNFWGILNTVQFSGLPDLLSFEPIWTSVDNVNKSKAPQSIESSNCRSLFVI